MSLLDKASLIVTPNGYSENTIYSVIPSSGAGDLTFTRATDGWRTNSQGLVQRVAWNLVQYSEQFDNAAWTKIGSGLGTTPIVTSNFAIAPDGSLTADRVQCSNIGGSGAEGNYSLVLQSNIPLSASGTLSIYLKSLTGVTQNVLVYWAGGQGTVFQVTSQWQRFTIPNLTPPTSGVSLGTRGGVGWYTGGDAVIDIAVWGAQVVEGSSALEYFPTTDRQDVPRIDYSLGGCPTLLMEPQRTNLQLNSEDFSTYGQLNVTTTVNQTTAPTGLSTADLIAETAVTSGHSVFNNLACSVTSGTTYTLSCYFKKGPGATAPDIIQLSSPQGFTSLYANFNITTGVVTQSSGVVSTSITSVGNGWWRCSLTATASSTTSFSGLIVAFVNNNPTSGASPSYLGQVTSNIYAWGGQVEAGAYATSYIPTTTASVTRNVDVANRAGISSLLGQTEGTIFYDMYIPQPSGLGVQALASITNDAGTLFYTAYVNNTISFDMYIGGTYTFALTTATGITAGRNRFALVYKAGAYKLFLNGVLSATSTNSTPITNTISKPGLTADKSPIYNYSFIAFKEALSDSELELLTGDSFDSYAKMAAYFNYTLQ